MKILLVQPANNTQFDVGFHDIMMWSPLPLEIIAGCLRHHDVEILDMRLEGGLDETISRFRPDIVGVTSRTPDVHNALLICKGTKEIDPEILTVVGGIHPTISPGDFDAPFVDVIVIGEGEVTFREIADTREKGGPLREIPGIAYRDEGERHFTPARPLIRDLDTVPLPDHEITRKYKDRYKVYLVGGYGTVETGRGCPYRCNFCCVWKQNRGTFRQMSPERIFEKIAATEDEMIFIVDDNFLVDPRVAWNLHRIIKERGLSKEIYLQSSADAVARNPALIEAWREIGLTHVFLGLEAAEDRHLEMMHKKARVEHNVRAIEILHANEIVVFASSLIACTDFEPRDFDVLIDFVDSHKIFATFAILTPFPGTDLHREMEGRIVTRDYRLYDCVHLVSESKLPREAYYTHFARLYRTIFTLKDRRDFLPEGMFARAMEAATEQEVANFLKGTKNLMRAKYYLRDHERSEKEPPVV